MYPDVHLPKPLPIQDLYTLLVLAQEPRHAYALRSAVLHSSLGSVKIAPGRLYTLIDHLLDQGLIDFAGQKPAGVSGKPRTHYTISAHGTLRLKTELTRLNHLLAIAKNTGLMTPDPIPLDLQRMLCDVVPYSHKD